MNAEIHTKLATILDIVITSPRDSEETFARLALDFERHLLNLTGDRLRDIDQLQYETEGETAWFVGLGGGVRRLLFTVELESTASAHLTLRATKGRIDIAEIDWGDTGPDIGNSLLVMRLLHVAICSFRALGFERLTNDPWNDRLRTLYSSFGFSAGETLELGNSVAVLTALTVIARTYSRFDIDLSAPPP